MDALFSKFFTHSASWNYVTAANDKADEWLEAGGLASWQTPEISKRGALMKLAGACRGRIGPSQSDALRREYGRSSNLRETGYFTSSFDEGLADTELQALTIAQCNRAITTYRLAVDRLVKRR